MTNENELHSHKYTSWALLILLTVIWGSSFILIKKGLTIFSASQVAAIRILSASIFMIPFALSWIRKIDKKYYLLIFVSGFTGSFVPAFLFAIAQTRLDSGVTGIVNALTPVFVLIVGVLFYRQRITFLIVIGLLLAFSGTSVLMLTGTGEQHNYNYYALFVVAATILYGINVNIIKFNFADINPIAISSISMFFIGPIAAIQLFIFTDFTDKLTLGDQAIITLSYLMSLGVVGTSLALMLFNKLLKIASPLFSSSVTYLMPIVAVIWGLIDGENLIFSHYLSLGIIICGVFLTNKKF